MLDSSVNSKTKISVLKLIIDASLYAMQDFVTFVQEKYKV